MLLAIKVINLKFSVCVPNVLLGGNVYQIFNLGPIFYLEHCVKQQLFQSLPLHTGPSLNCPGETAELWQSELSWPLVRT